MFKGSLRLLVRPSHKYVPSELCMCIIWLRNMDNLRIFLGCRKNVLTVTSSNMRFSFATRSVYSRTTITIVCYHQLFRPVAYECLRILLLWQVHVLRKNERDIEREKYIEVERDTQWSLFSRWRFIYAKRSCLPLSLDHKSFLMLW